LPRGRMSENHFSSIEEKSFENSEAITVEGGASGIKLL